MGGLGKGHDCLYRKLLIYNHFPNRQAPIQYAIPFIFPPNEVLMSRKTLIFSCLGHFHLHLFAAFYFTIVLTLQDVWALPYDALIELWFIPGLMLGLAALPAGMLGDRIGAPTMMAIFFIGMGGSAVAAGFTDSPDGLLICMIGIGVFGAIYHPVGVPWLVATTANYKGKALGIHGIFGSLGTAAAALVAGFLIANFNWRWAFIVPGVACSAIGLALIGLSRRQQEATTPKPVESTQKKDHKELRYTFMVLLVTMFLAALIYNCTQTVLPKLFELRLHFATTENAAAEVFRIGVMVSIVYAAAAVMQFLGGHLADRYPLKWVYALGLAVQVPLLSLIAYNKGPLLMALAAFAVMLNVGTLPAENILLSRTAPANRQGLVFGIKFVLSFAAAPIAVKMAALFSGYGFDWLFVTMAGVALCACLVACLLPSMHARTTAWATQ